MPTDVPGSPAITYIGGPTALLEWAGLRILIDPTFDAPGSYEDPGSTPLVKTVGPALTVAEVGAVDLVLLSHHGHPDNLDDSGRELSLASPVVLSTTLAATELGSPVVGLDAWETHRVGAATVTALPALHGPPGSEPFVGPVIGFVLEAPDAPSVYVSGDNASLALVESIAERFAPVGIAVIFAGAARVPGIDAELTLTSENAARAAELLGAGIVVGVHTEHWEHFSETRAQLEAAFAASGAADALVATPPGVRVDLV